MHSLSRYNGRTGKNQMLRRRGQQGSLWQSARDALDRCFRELRDVNTSSGVIEAVTEARCARIAHSTSSVVVRLVCAIREDDLARYAAFRSLHDACLAGVEHQLVVSAFVDVL